ncbi:Inner nuclear membrane protein HEH2 [Fusarium oxysporum f. sp. albedinis]|nr:Inner nuclear membrane protein HEH2 [Fusarium oxysporum f. sp. albedinis]
MLTNNAATLPRLALGPEFTIDVGVLGITLSPSDAHMFVSHSTFIIMLSLRLGWYIQRCEEGHFRCK